MSNHTKCLQKKKTKQQYYSYTESKGYSTVTDGTQPPKKTKQNKREGWGKDDVANFIICWGDSTEYNINRNNWEHENC